MFTRAPLFVATALVLGVALAGCGSDSEPAGSQSTASKTTAAAAPSPTEAPEGRLLTSADAKAALPAVSELSGAGWKTDAPAPDEPDPTIEPASCTPAFVQFSTDYAAYKPKLAAKENVTYVNETSGYTDVLFEVSSWTNAADATLPIQAAASVDQCPSFTATSSDGTKLTMKAKKLTPLALGEKQAAVQFAVSQQGTTLYFTVFEAAIGHNLIAVAHTGMTADDPQKSFEPLVQGVLTDLKGA